jgi:hypothetical protein
MAGDGPGPEGRKKPGPKPRPKEQRKSDSIGFRCSPGWREWLAAFAEHLGLAEAQVIDAALTNFSVARGFRPPPRR